MDETNTIDRTGRSGVIRFDDDEIGIRELQFLQTVASEHGMIQIADRAEMESDNVLQYGDYDPKFTASESTEIASLMLMAKQDAVTGEYDADRLDDIIGLSETFATKLTERLSGRMVMDDE